MLLKNHNTIINFYYTITNKILKNKNYNDNSIKKNIR